MKRISLALLAVIIFFAFGDFGNFKTEDQQENFVVRIFPTFDRVKADVVNFPIVDGSTPTSTELTALEETFVREGFTIGSNAVKADFDQFATSAWQRLTLVQRSALDSAVASEVAETGAAAGLSEFIIPAALAVGVFSLGYYLYENQGQLLDFMTTTTSNVTLPTTMNGDVIGYTFNWNGSTVGAVPPSSWVVGQGGSSRVALSIAQGTTYTITSTYLSWADSGHTLVSTKSYYTDSTGKTGSFTNVFTAASAGFQALTSSTTSDVPTATPVGTVDQDTSYYNNDYTQTTGNNVSVTAPDPTKGLTSSQYQSLKSSPTSTVTPTQGAEPTATGSQDTTWWKWLMAPLASIQQLITSWYHDAIEWATSIISKIADLANSLGQWFNSLIGDLGGWFQTLWDKLGQLLTDLGQWLQPLGDWFAHVWTDIEALPGEIGDLLKSVEADIQALPDAIGNWFLNNIVGDPNNIHYDKLKMSADIFTTKFPFSLPWDVEKALHAVFGMFSSQGAPEWQYTINALGQSFTFTIKFPDIVVSWAPFIRDVMLLMFDISLVYSVRKLLGGAK